MLYDLDLTLQYGSEYIKSRLENSFSWLKERGFVLSIKEHCNSRYHVLSLSLCGPNYSGVFDNDDIVLIFKHQLAEILSDAIVSHWEKELIRKQVQKAYRRLPRSEQLDLIERAHNMLRRCNGSESLNLFLKFGRKTKMSHRILEQLNNTSSLNIEGLIRFCLQDYQKEICFAVELAYEDMRNEKQYREFVRLLRYFVDNQPARIYEVHILLKGQYLEFWDHRGERITSDFWDLYPWELEDDLSNLDDLLISILMTAAPRRIVYHAADGWPESENLSTILQVFNDRIGICKGCNRCLDRSWPQNDL